MAIDIEQLPSPRLEQCLERGQRDRIGTGDVDTTAPPGRRHLESGGRFSTAVTGVQRAHAEQNVNVTCPLWKWESMTRCYGLDRHEIERAPAARTAGTPETVN
ncbi:hypothetical protein RBH26_18440 [Natronolimnohabitans sp. A-GB9]|uniref:hypothetical protein n=1 Tax=Natronolimnohabitans sp. A-GB9 TaxID=3069757 RepID=UPI0027B3B3AA|nr:hypothetical protein [Natronolimnohabitans sp. A-GB9]MDQ2052448.1 hypothetical protein [Natronolimnohabitans sp. A-GB9]